MASKTRKPSPAKGLTKSVDKKREMEAANLARRKKEFENEKDPKKLLQFHKWEQTESEVTIWLFAGKKVGTNEISVNYTSNDVTVSLTDGRKWYCHFNQPIDMSKSRVQLQKMKVILRVVKAEPRKVWSSYQFSPDENGEDATAPVKNALDSSHNEPDEPQETGHCNESQLVDVTPISAAGDQTAGATGIIDDGPVPPSNRSQESVNEKGIEEIEQSKDNQLDAGDIGDDVARDEDNDDGVIVELNHVKHDFYEKNVGTIVAVLYVKQICQETIKVNFAARSFSVQFRTSDIKFLDLHKVNHGNVSFLWKIDLVDNIIPEKCSYTVTELRVSLTLVKVAPKKWNALEASQARDAQMPLNAARWQQPVKTPAMSNENNKAETQAGTIDKNRVVSSAAAVRSSILSDSNKANTSQKPTCMVSPLNKEPSLLNSLPLGMTGLDNLGNTCFLNSVVQVLANTTELRDYFLGGHFQKELNHDNPLGTGGKLAVSFATLMRILWSGKYRSYAPAKLKNLVGMKNSQFMGFAQHDAQEFMAYLLDGLHEDLNRVKNKPYTSEVDSDGRPDEVVANEAWARYKSRNDSFIVDLFQGQYKSKLVCPVCNKVSITFDPFMHLSVPLPRKNKKQLHVIFMSRDPLKKPVKYVLWLSKDATVDDLKELMYQKTGIPASNLRVFESYKNKIHSLLYQGFSLANFTPRDNIYVCEVLSEKLAGEEVYEIPCIQTTEYPVMMPTKCASCKRECEQGLKLKRCTKCMRIAYCNQTCQKQDWERHQSSCVFTHDCVGQPFFISLPKSQATFSRIAQMMEAFSRYSLDVFQPPVTPSSQTTPDVTQSPGVVSACSSGCIDSLSSSSSVGTAAPSTITQMPSTDLITSDLEAQPLFDSQTTSTTEVASTSSDSSFVTIDSGIDHVMEDNMSVTTDNNQTALEVEPVPNNKEVDSNILLDSSDDGSFGTPSPPTGFVMGRQQDRAERVELPFSIRPCTSDGKLIGDQGAALQDRGDKPLDLTHIRFLAMHWKNNEKYPKPYVLVQSKAMDCDEDESVSTASTEETSNITLDQCLSLFTEPEVLSPDHAWYCPRCKEHREATKQLSIWRLPAYLIIQLKRFSFSSFIWRDKIDKMVEYPVRGLDLRKHFVGMLPSSEPPPIYDLYGVVNHMGGILGGHYTSYARCPDSTDWRKNEIGWRLFDDSMVSLVSESQVMTRAGYVLFYRRRKMTVTVPTSIEDIGDEEEDDNRIMDTNILDEQPSGFLTVDNGQESEFIDGDAVADDGCTVPSNSPSMYSLPSTRIDMDTVD